MKPIIAAPQAFQLPAALVSQGYALRPETDVDLPFLQHLYGTTRAFELAHATDWNDAQKHAFVLSQFAAQRHHYRTHYPDVAYDVIEQAGTPVGRLYLEDRPCRLHIIDIVLMPEARGMGLGSSILSALIEAAGAQQKGVGIFVERYNPALRLYQRLGFTQVGEADLYLEMEWRADQAKVAQ